MSKIALFFSAMGIILILAVAIFSTWYMATDTSWSLEAREKDFQSKLAECEQFAEKYGDNWRAWDRVNDDSCSIIFEEYRHRIDEEEKRQAIDKAEKQSVNDGAAPEPPDTE